jgi:maltokinase
MVSGCAIMVLVEAQTGFAAASYATDTRLLAELRASWPPASGPNDDRDGYRPTDLASLEMVGAVRLTDRFAVALAADPGDGDGSFLVTPMARDDARGRWRIAIAGDGLSAFVAGVPMASERSIAVDQTNASVVVGERAIVKWFRRVGPGPSRAATLVAHLGAVGFAGIPVPLGSLVWVSPDDVELTLAQGDAFLPGARDGWEWCVEGAVAGAAAVGGELGRLVAGLHLALATPSAVIDNPLGIAAAGLADSWRRTARETLADAQRLSDGDDAVEMGIWLPAMLDALDWIGTNADIAIQPIHGDLHVGQVLEWSGGLAVIDFDGNPTLGALANAVRQPVERDIAQMHASLDLVGRVARKSADVHRAAAIDRWIEEARSGFLEAVGPFDQHLVAAFEIEQLCRELVYAARFLPRWRYAPMAALRARYGR